MISFVDVTKYYQRKNEIQLILHDVSAVFPTRARVGIMAPAGGGKSTVARLMVGQERPDRGQVLSEGRISWPLGFSAAFNRNLTGEENMRLFSRIYGSDPDEVSAYCHEFSELGRQFFNPVESYSIRLRAKLGFALSMALEFDMYLADDTVSAGDQRFRKKCEEALERRLEMAGLVLFTTNARLVERFCDVPVVLRDGGLIFCDSFDEMRGLYDCAA